jgi:DNA-binding CsgD family transcriptional regulator/PAS domain-containing protein
VLPDREALSELLGTLYDAAANPALWEQFLAQLGRSTGATSAVLVIYDSARRSYILSRDWQFDPEARTLYAQHYGALDLWGQLWGQRALSKGENLVCSSEALCPSTEPIDTGIYNDFLTRLGLEHRIFALFENTGSRLISCGLFRHAAHGPFDADALALLRFLAPHVQRAVGLHAKFSELTNRFAGLEAALNSLATGVMFTGPEGRVSLMNRSASEMLSERDGLVITNAGRLRAERPAESDQLASAIQGAAQKSNDGKMGGAVLVSRRSRPPLQVLVGPIGSSAALSFCVGDPISAVAFITDPARRQRPAENVLRAMFGLSPAECRVALLLSDGHAARQIADMIGVSENTVRSQVKSIYFKSGVRRQGELMRLLLANSVVTARL